SDGASPPDVFSRWMKVVIDSVLSPGFGPFLTPAIGSRSQAMASDATKAVSVQGIALPPQTVLVSFEYCHIARIIPPSDGLGLTLKKWVMTCFPSTLSNNVASGVKSMNWKLSLPSSVGRQM